MIVLNLAYQSAVLTLAKHRCHVGGHLHHDELIVSPGPYARLNGDTLYFVGNEAVVETVYNFFYQNNTQRRQSALSFLLSDN